MIDKEVRERERQVARNVRAAVAAGDPCGFLRELEAGGILAGYKRGLRARFPHLDESDLDAILGESPDELYRALQTRTVPEPLAYLYKIMCNRSAAVDALRRLEVPLDREHRSAPADEGMDREELWARHCARGFREVRRMIRQLPSEKQQHVIGYYIDALEKGHVDLTAAEVGDALGLNEVYVRQLKKRAIDRLREIATEEGLELDFDFGSFDVFVDEEDWPEAG